jgi:hypothetical protein
MPASTKAFTPPRRRWHYATAVLFAGSASLAACRPHTPPRLGGQAALPIEPTTAQLDTLVPSGVYDYLKGFGPDAPRRQDRHALPAGRFDRDIHDASVELTFLTQIKYPYSQLL